MNYNYDDTTVLVKIWIDDIRPAPSGYKWIKSTNQAIKYLQTCQWYDKHVVDVAIIIDIDHDAGDYASDGGDYIRILDWMEEHHMGATFHIHSMNPVGVQNLRSIIEKNRWREIL